MRTLDRGGCFDVGSWIVSTFPVLSVLLLFAWTYWGAVAVLLLAGGGPRVADVTTLCACVMDAWRSRGLVRGEFGPLDAPPRQARSPSPLAAPEWLSDASEEGAEGGLGDEDGAVAALGDTRDSGEEAAAVEEPDAHFFRVHEERVVDDSLSEELGAGLRVRSRRMDM